MTPIETLQANLDLAAAIIDVLLFIIVALLLVISYAVLFWRFERRKYQNLRQSVAQAGEWAAALRAQSSESRMGR